MPVYNGQNYLAAAIDSLLCQTFEDFELIISDNGSRDATEQICRDYAARDRRIAYERQPQNIGAITNFNHVFQVSGGEYFKWAAHDDVCQPQFLQTCVAMLDDHPQVAWCHVRSDMIDSEGKSWVSQLPADAEELEIQPDGSRWWKGLPRKDYDSDQAYRRFAGVLLGTNWCVDSYGLIRASALRKTRLLTQLYGAEKVLMGELSLVGKYMQSPEMLFAQRVHSEASSSLGTASAQDTFAAIRHARPFFSTRMALLQAHLGAVKHADLSRLDALRCQGVVLRYLFQVHKWGRVLSMMLRGAGIGGGGKRMLDARNKKKSIATGSSK
jgi:glycosyltransferase involved in cell wall biosynthesis